MLITDIPVDFCHDDDRGSLTQLAHNSIGQVNILVSRKGSIRGNHYHKISTESFYVVSGSVEVSGFKDNETDKRFFKTGDFFQIKPYVVHSMTFPEDCVLVAMYDICVEKVDGTMDIYKWEGAQ